MPSSRSGSTTARSTRSVRLFEPRLSPFTTAVASGSIRVVGELADFDHLLVDATVDSVDLRLFDYALKSGAHPHHARQARRERPGFAARGRGPRLCVLAARVGLRDRRIALRRAAMNLGILQGILPRCLRVGPRRAHGIGRTALSTSPFSPAVRPSSTGASVICRCPTRSTPSTASSGSTRAASASTMCRRGWVRGRCSSEGGSVSMDFCPAT